MRRSMSLLLSATLIATSIPINSYAEVSTNKNPDRWSFRNVYSNYVEKLDGTFPEGLLGEEEKHTPKLYQNLVNLNYEDGGIAPNPNDPKYPKGEGKIIYQTPMFVELPDDLINKVGPEDLEIYTLFSEPGTNVKGKIPEDKIKEIYERSDTHKSTSELGEDFIGGNPDNPILIW